MKISYILSKYMFKPAIYPIEYDLLRDITYHGDCIYCEEAGYLEQIPDDDEESYHTVYKFKCEYCGNTFLVGRDWVEAPEPDKLEKARDLKANSNFGFLDIAAYKANMKKFFGEELPIINSKEEYFLVSLNTDYLDDNPKINTSKAMKILGVKSLDKHEIRIKYRESLKLFHPDRNHFITNKDASYYIKMIKNSYNHLVEVSNMYYKNK